MGKKIPKKEIENMTSRVDDVVQKLCILGFVEKKSFFLFLEVQRSVYSSLSKRFIFEYHEKLIK